MTEYDYSPAALERHKAHMEGVGIWAKEASSHPPADPYSIPTPHLNAMRLPPEQPSGHRHRSKSIVGGTLPSPTFPVPVPSATRPVVPHSGEFNGNVGPGPSSHTLHYYQPNPMLPVPVRSSTHPVVPHSGEFHGDAGEGRSSRSAHHSPQNADPSSKQPRKSTRSCSLSEATSSGSQPNLNPRVPIRSSTQPVVPYSGELYDDSQGHSSHSLHYVQKHSDSSSKQSSKASRSHSRSRPTTSGGFIPPVPALPPNPRSSSHRRSNTQQIIRVATGNSDNIPFPTDGRKHKAKSPETFKSDLVYAPPQSQHQPPPMKQAPLLKRIFEGLTRNNSSNVPPAERQHATPRASFRERRKRRQSF